MPSVLIAIAATVLLALLTPLVFHAKLNGLVLAVCWSCQST
jgi:hypothetical protein